MRLKFRCKLSGNFTCWILPSHIETVGTELSMNRCLNIGATGGAFTFPQSQSDPATGIIGTGIGWICSSVDDSTGDDDDSVEFSAFFWFHYESRRAVGIVLNLHEIFYIHEKKEEVWELSVQHAICAESEDFQLRNFRLVSTAADKNWQEKCFVCFAEGENEKIRIQLKMLTHSKKKICESTTVSEGTLLRLNIIVTSNRQIILTEYVTRAAKLKASRADLIFNFFFCTMNKA